MALFSRAFIRKRAISLATTMSVAATSLALAQDPAKTPHVRRGIQYVADRQEHPNAAAMQGMMADMTIKPTGDSDRDFVEMMVPHHQGAVDMARAELKYARSERLRDLARRTVTTQQQEITFMKNAVNRIR